MFRACILTAIISNFKFLDTDVVLTFDISLNGEEFTILVMPN